MKLAIFGSTGQTGQQLVEQALAGGHIVRTIARRPLAISSQNLHVETGSIFDATAVTVCAAGADAVLSVVGFGSSLFRTPVPAESYSGVASALVHSMRTAGVGRLLFCTSAGVEDDPSEIWVYRHVLKPLILQKEYVRMAAGEAIIKASGLDWTCVRPGRLTNGPLTQTYRVADGRRPAGGTFVSRADVAHFFIAEALASNWVHKSPTLAM